MRDGVASVDAVVSLTGFSLVGGPAYNDSRAAEALLAQLDVPYLAAHPVEFQTLEQWEADPRGLLPVEATMMVALPELDGGIAPMMFGGRCGRERRALPGCDGKPARDMVGAPRARRDAGRPGRAGWWRCGGRRGRQRRVAVVLFNFPPNAGATGTAAYLARVRHRCTTRCGACSAPATRSTCRRTPTRCATMVVGRQRSAYGTDANVAARIRVDDHVRRQRWLGEIEAAWGPAPGRQQ